jgi:tetratricopeptide (TPR) repeat protein
LAINKRKILESAQKHLQRGALDKALEDYRILLKADPQDSNVLLKIGDLHLKQGKRDEAINAYLRVAQQFTREGFDAKAVALYKQISRLDPKRQDVCVPLSDLYARMGLVSEAIAALQGAADAAYRDGDKDGALELLRRMAGLDPANTQNRLKVAELLSHEGRRHEALSEYQAVAEELARRGEDEERLRVLERMLVADPESAPTLLEVARGKLATSEFASARKLAERLLALQPDDIEGREILGHALHGEGAEPRARETFRELAELYRLRGDEGRARDLMQRFGDLEALGSEDSDAALESDFSALELGEQIGDDDFLLEEEPSAAPLRSSTEPRPPAPAPALHTPRVAAVVAAQVAAPVAPAASTTPARSAAEHEPEDLDQLLAEATVYLRYGKHERAAAALRAILAQAPGHRLALENLGEALAALGETAHAVTALQRAADGARVASDGEALTRICERLARLDPAAAAALELPAAASEAAAFEIDLDLEGSLESIEEPTLAAESEPEAMSFDLDGFDETPAAEPEAAPRCEPETTQGLGAGISAQPAADDLTAMTPARVAEDLEEARFYLEQGLLDEARGLYQRILSAVPNQPQAMLRLGELEARGGPAPALALPAPVEAFASAVAPAPPAASAKVDPSPAAAVGPEVGVFDLAAELSGVFGSDEPSLRTLAGTEEEGFEQVFHAFKTGIERELGDSDHEARYDLGIAYKEMGLLEDAIAAFQIAMLAPARLLACLHMLGLCALELGRAADAVAHLEQALSVPDLPADQRIPLRYDAGRAYAALGDSVRARAAFEEVREADPGFGDIERELSALEAPVAEGDCGEPEASGEAYESFDNLLSDGPPAAPPARYESFEDLFSDEPNETPVEPAEPLLAVPEPVEPDAAEAEPPAGSDAEPEAAAETPTAQPTPPAAAQRRRRKISFV